MTAEELFDLIKEIDQKTLYMLNTRNHSNLDYYLAPSTSLKNCVTTTKGLHNAFCRFFDIPRFPANITFENLTKQMEENNQKLSNNTCEPNTLFTYQFRFSGYLSKKNFGDSRSIHHNFTIIQYKNSNQETRYRFLESYILQYSLSEFISESENNGNSHDFSQEDFNLFMKEFAIFSKSKIWTKDIRAFHEKYFNVDINLEMASILQDQNDNWNPSANQTILPLIFDTMPVSIQYSQFILNTTKNECYSKLRDFKKNNTHKLIVYRTDRCANPNTSTNLLLDEIATLSQQIVCPENISLWIERKQFKVSIIHVSSKSASVLKSLQSENSLPDASTQARFTIAYKGQKLEQQSVEKGAHPLSPC